MLVHQLFERAVTAQGDTIALEYDGEQLSYAELNRRANQLAHHLRSLGVGPDARVAICIERSISMVVGLLAILEGGRRLRAARPILPGRPPGLHAVRLRADGSADANEPQAGLCGPGRARARAGRGGRAAYGLPDTNPLVDGLAPNSLAYVIYTSGSTGQPKGVMNEHAWRRQPPAVGAGRVPPRRRRPRAAKNAFRLRRVGVGVLPSTAGRFPPRDGASTGPSGSGLSGAGDRVGSKHHDHALRAVDAANFPARRRSVAVRFAAPRAVQR
ncbi:AMP-binding protein [Massilia sp. B-10]|nr:AMP-binding protein [Massilia sp. B-10]